MLPVALSFKKLPILLIGQDEKLHARKEKLIELGAVTLKVVDSEFDKIDFTGFPIVMIVGLNDDLSEDLHDKAKVNGALVNVEDNRKYCDFFFPSYLKRGDLVISVSSNGKSPATSKIIRDKLAQIFPAIWSKRIEEIGYKRSEWKKEGQTYEEIDQHTQEYIKKNSWLD